MRIYPEYPQAKIVEAISNMRRKANYIVALLLAAVLLFSMAGCKKDKDKEELTAPETYMVGEESIPALEMTEGTIAREELSETGGEYTYKDMPEPGLAAQVYAVMMTSEENGYTIVDKAGDPAEEPDYTTEEGTVRLVKSSSEAGKLLKVSLSWTQESESCVVKVETIEGRLSAPEAEGMSIMELLDFIRAKDPKALGLEGSMSDYYVYAREGLVLVDKRSCVQVNIYSRDAEGNNTNEIVGEYLITSDGTHLYKLDSVAGKVTELN